MAIKAILFEDPECGQICKDAFKGIKEITGKDEVEKMNITEGLKKFDLGEPEGVPFIGFVSEATGKCISKAFFHDEEGKITLQKYGGTVEKSIKTD